MSSGDWLIGATLVVAVADWVAVACGTRPAEFVLKPLTIVLLIAAAFAFRSSAPPARFDLTLVALLLSLAGDVFLMVPKDLFVAGLASFLLAHLAYVGAFCVGPDISHRAADYGPGISTGSAVRVAAIAAIGVLVVAVALFLRIRRGILQSGHRELVVPVAVYVIAISAMVVAALSTLGRPYWGAEARVFAIGGATLFFVSDALIGWTRFVRAYRWGPVAIIATYHLGQVGLVLGLLGGVMVAS